MLSGAIAAALSWRGVLRELGLVATSAGSMRSVRNRANELGLDYSHFRGQRAWTEQSLRDAVCATNSWAEVLQLLGVRDDSASAAVRRDATRLGLDVAQLDSGPEGRQNVTSQPSIHNLSRAGSLIAAAWYTMSGHDVSWPLEPNRYDLLVYGELGSRRVQVKTTTTYVDQTWKVYLSTSGRHRRTYGPDEIDEFFIIDGDFRFYLIPVDVVAGLQAIHLRAYERYERFGWESCAQSV